MICLKGCKREAQRMLSIQDIPESQTRNLAEVSIIGNENRSRFDRLGGNPDIVHGD